jgi:hypothetical protein
MKVPLHVPMAGAPVVGLPFYCLALGGTRLWRYILPCVWALVPLGSLGFPILCLTVRTFLLSVGCLS